MLHQRRGPIAILEAGIEQPFADERRDVSALKNPQGAGLRINEVELVSTNAQAARLRERVAWIWAVVDGFSAIASKHIERLTRNVIDQELVAARHRNMP